MTELNVGVRIDKKKKKKREKNKYSIYKYSIYYGICGVFQTICGTVHINKIGRQHSKQYNIN